MDDELRAIIRQLSKEQLVYVLETILNFEPVDMKKCRNLIIYGSQDSHAGGLRQQQTGDGGQVRADRQYKG